MRAYFRVIPGGDMSPKADRVYRFGNSMAGAQSRWAAPGLAVRVLNLEIPSRSYVNCVQQTREPRDPQRRRPGGAIRAQENLSLLDDVVRQESVPRDLELRRALHELDALVAAGHDLAPGAEQHGDHAELDGIDEPRCREAAEDLAAAPQ